MARQQGAPSAPTAQATAQNTPSAQMGAERPTRVVAAFGTGGGAAIVFSDLASI